MKEREKCTDRIPAVDRPGYANISPPRDVCLGSPVGRQRKKGEVGRGVGWRLGLSPPTPTERIE